MGFEESFPDQRLKSLYRYWTAKRTGRALPGRPDIDPADLLTTLPHLLLIDVIEGGQDFRYRLVGTEIQRHIGRPVTGHLVSETLSGEYLDYIHSLHRLTVDEAVAIYSESNFIEGLSGFAPTTEYKRTYRLMLPLAKNGVSVDMLLCGQIFGPIRQRDEPDLLLVDK
jgi:hypothetical protein